MPARSPSTSRCESDIRQGIAWTSTLDPFNLFGFEFLQWRQVLPTNGVLFSPCPQAWTHLTCSGFARPGPSGKAHLGGRLIHLLSLRHPLVSGGAELCLEVDSRSHFPLSVTSSFLHYAPIYAAYSPLYVTSRYLCLAAACVKLGSALTHFV
jgi:hypothetical protein